MGEFIKDPTKLLRRIVPREHRRSFDVGRTAFALEVVTQIRTLELQTVYAVTEVAPIVAALHTLLTDAGFDEGELWDLYDKVSSSRRGGFSRASQPPRSAVVADLPRGLNLLERDVSSPDAALEGESFQLPLAVPFGPQRLSSDPSSSEREEPSVEDLQVAYARGKDLGLLDGPERSGIRLPRRRRRNRG